MTIGRKTFLRRLGAGALAWGGAATLRAAEEPLPPFAGTDDGPFWAAVRATYSLERGFGYFNTGGLGPAPDRVLAAYENTARRLQEHSETGHALFDEARAICAGFLGVDPDELAFVRNTTEGNSIVAAGLGLRRGDEVIFESHAHPGGSFPWLNLEKLHGIAVKVFKPDVNSAAGNLARLAELITPRTRVVQVSHVTAPTGLLMPVREIAALCRERGVWCHIDGAQSAGMLPFSLRAIGADSFATSGHKWLGGPHESGLLFVRRDRLDAVAPTAVGAYSSDDYELPGRLVYVASARRYEYGTRNAATAVALAEAMRFQNDIGRENVAARIRRLAARVRDGLASLPDVEILTPSAPELSAAMVTFRTPRVSYQTLFGRLLREHRLRCRPVTEQGLDALRVSTHLFNSLQECDRLVEAITNLVRSA